jgi:hypothetical protein
MKTWTVTVHFPHTVSKVQITAHSVAEAKRLAEAQYSGQQVGTVTENR